MTQQSTQPPTPIGRLAPSPTGVLHVGNARSLLWAWLSVRARGGRLYLRVEDLLPGAPEHIASVLEDLSWLGLDWDPPPEESPGRARCEEFTSALQDAPDFILQSRRGELYRRLITRLDKVGLVYPCVCTRKDIALASRAPHAEERGNAYPGTCRGRFNDEAAAIRWEGARALRHGRSPLGAALRLRVPTGAVQFKDAFHGDTTIDVAREFGDFVIRKKDSLYAYMFAVVVDDLEMGVTEVVRGDDLLECTAQQLVVYRALTEHVDVGRGSKATTQASIPEWVHVPLVLGEDGRRLAKRNRSIHVRNLAAEGVSPWALRAWMAQSMGLPATGDLDALVQAWPTAQLNPNPVVFAGPEVIQ